MINNVKDICKAEGLLFQSCAHLGGGDINDAYLVNASQGRSLLKINTASLYPGMFAREAEGLKALHQQTTIKIPEVLAWGEYSGKQYLLLEWLQKTECDDGFWELFASGMADIHKVTNSYFGWPTSNYIGSVPQQNEHKVTWPEFYGTQRIMPLVQKLFDESCLEQTDIKAAEKLCLRLSNLFPEEPPSLLHGDFWSGNFMAIKDDRNKKSLPAIYDPAVYFGHREMDLGMSLLFGGFNSRFYESYHSFYPLEGNWKKRAPLAQLYPLLVHAILFGGAYISQCKMILNNWGG